MEVGSQKSEVKKLTIFFRIKTIIKIFLKFFCCFNLLKINILNSKKFYWNRIWHIVGKNKNYEQRDKGDKRDSITSENSNDFR